MGRLAGRGVWALVLGLMAVAPAAADDWAQWMGPTRDGVWHETGIVEKFPEGGLKVNWRVPVQGGYSGPAVVNGKVYVTDYALTKGTVTNKPGERSDLNGKERVLCFDAKTGKQLWNHEYDCPYQISYPAGPRATPTVAEGLVYTLGAEGHLYCLDADKGDVIWSKVLQKEYNTPAPIWGFCGHPLIDGDKLICLVGGEGSVAVAFDRKTGQEIWKALSASESGYAPPSIIEAAGVRQLIIWDADRLNSLNPETGEVYWSQPLKPSFGMSIMAPRKAGDLLFASGIGKVGAAFMLDQSKPGAKLAWQGEAKTAMYCANSTPLVDGKTMYGVDCETGYLMGMDVATGERLWETGQPTIGERRARHGTAFIVRNADRYFLFSETGDLILANLTPKGYEEISRFHVLEPTGECFGRSVVWTHPAFAERTVFARNDKELVSVSLEKQE